MKVLNLKEFDAWMDMASSKITKPVFDSDFQYILSRPMSASEVRTIFSNIVFWLITDNSLILRISSNQSNNSKYSNDIYQKMLDVKDKTDNPFDYPAIKFEHGAVKMASEYCLMIHALEWSFTLYRTDLNAAVIYMTEASQLAVYFNERHVLMQINSELKRFGFASIK